MAPSYGPLRDRLQKAAERGLLDLDAVDAFAREAASEGGAARGAADVLQGLWKQAKGGRRPAALEAFDLCSAAVLDSEHPARGPLVARLAPRLAAELLAAASSEPPAGPANATAQPPARPAAPFGEDEEDEDDSPGKSKALDPSGCPVPEERLCLYEALTLWADALPEKDKASQALLPKIRACLEKGCKDQPMAGAAPEVSARQWLKLIDGQDDEREAAATVRAALAGGQLEALAGLTVPAAPGDPRAAFQPVARGVLGAAGGSLCSRAGEVQQGALLRAVGKAAAPQRLEAKRAEALAEELLKALLADLLQLAKDPEQQSGGALAVCGVLRALLQEDQDGQDQDDDDDFAGGAPLSSGERCAFELVRMLLPPSVAPPRHCWAPRVRAEWREHVLEFLLQVITDDSATCGQLGDDLVAALRRIGQKQRPLARAVVREFAKRADQGRAAALAGSAWLRRQAVRDCRRLGFAPVSGKSAAATGQLQDSAGGGQELALRKLFDLCSPDESGRAGRRELYGALQSHHELAQFLGLAAASGPGLRDRLNACFPTTASSAGREVTWEGLVDFWRREVSRARFVQAPADEQTPLTDLTGRVFSEDEDDEDEVEDERDQMASGRRPADRPPVGLQNGGRVDDVDASLSMRDDDPQEQSGAAQSSGDGADMESKATEFLSGVYGEIGRANGGCVSLRGLLEIIAEAPDLQHCFHVPDDVGAGSGLQLDDHIELEDFVAHFFGAGDVPSLEGVSLQAIPAQPPSQEHSAESPSASAAAGGKAGALQIDTDSPQGAAARCGGWAPDDMEEEVLASPEWDAKGWMRTGVTEASVSCGDADLATPEQPSARRALEPGWSAGSAIPVVSAGSTKALEESALGSSAAASPGPPGGSPADGEAGAASLASDDALSPSASQPPLPGLGLTVTTVADPASPAGGVGPPALAAELAGLLPSAAAGAGPALGASPSEEAPPPLPQEEAEEVLPLLSPTPRYPAQSPRAAELDLAASRTEDSGQGASSSGTARAPGPPPPHGGSGSDRLAQLGGESPGRRPSASSAAEGPPIPEPSAPAMAAGSQASTSEAGTPKLGPVVAAATPPTTSAVATVGAGPAPAGLGVACSVAPTERSRSVAEEEAPPGARRGGPAGPEALVEAAAADWARPSSSSSSAPPPDPGGGSSGRRVAAGLAAAPADSSVASAAAALVQLQVQQQIAKLHEEVQQLHRQNQALQLQNAQLLSHIPTAHFDGGGRCATFEDAPLRQPLAQPYRISAGVDGISTSSIQGGPLVHISFGAQHPQHPQMAAAAAEPAAPLQQQQQQQQWRAQAAAPAHWESYRDSPRLPAQDSTSRMTSRQALKQALLEVLPDVLQSAMSTMQPATRDFTEVRPIGLASAASAPPPLVPSRPVGPPMASQPAGLLGEVGTEVRTLAAELRGVGRSLTREIQLVCEAVQEAQRTVLQQRAAPVSIGADIGAAYAFDAALPPAFGDPLQWGSPSPACDLDAIQLSYALPPLPPPPPPLDLRRDHGGLPVSAVGSSASAPQAAGDWPPPPRLPAYSAAVPRISPGSPGGGIAYLPQTWHGPGAAPAHCGTPPLPLPRPRRGAAQPAAQPSQLLGAAQRQPAMVSRSAAIERQLGALDERLARLGTAFSRLGRPDG